MSSTFFASLDNLAAHLRNELKEKKFILLYAYNGTGKTRLSMAFKDIGKQGDARDTLYFNAFTEDLFTWDNDLESDTSRVLKINSASRFFAGLAEMEMDTRIRPLLSRYADFDFKIDTSNWTISFSRQVIIGNGEDARTENVDNIKISRGEENIFIWCFFLAIVQLRLDDDGTGPYNWVKHVYIDDPISSLDEHNAIVLANHLVQLYREAQSSISTVISTHHNLFFNVLHYEFKNLFKRQPLQYVLSQDRTAGGYAMRRQTGDTPSFHHVAALAELHRVSQGETIHTYHFNMLRVVLEKTALFHGYGHFSACIKKDQDDADGILHQRFVDLLSHGKYALFEPSEMGSETKDYFRKILSKFLESYPFNPVLFPPVTEESAP
ncbi:MAG: AAA family ATPase [Humidesulfovibrio sp.]|nr:AAA family ATPase [Humidesulfovibrio sp.]